MRGRGDVAGGDRGVGGACLLVSSVLVTESVSSKTQGVEMIRSKMRPFAAEIMQRRRSKGE